MQHTVNAPLQLKLLNWDKKSKNEQESMNGGLCKKGLSLREVMLPRGMFDSIDAGGFAITSSLQALISGF
jgi:hypothetical protein